MFGFSDTFTQQQNMVVSPILVLKIVTFTQGSVIYRSDSNFEFSGLTTGFSVNTHSVNRTGLGR